QARRRPAALAAQAPGSQGPEGGRVQGQGIQGRPASDQAGRGGGRAVTLRLVFMGTPDFSVPTLEALAGAGHDIAAVYTRAPRPAGRGMAERKTPVHRAAEARGIPVFTPKTFRDEAEQELFRSHKADAAVVVAYGLILP